MKRDVALHLRQLLLILLVLIPAIRYMLIIRSDRVVTVNPNLYSSIQNFSLHFLKMFTLASLVCSRRFLSSGEAAPRL